LSYIRGSHPSSLVTSSVYLFVDLYKICIGHVYTDELGRKMNPEKLRTAARRKVMGTPPERSRHLSDYDLQK